MYTAECLEYLQNGLIFRDSEGLIDPSDMVGVGLHGRDPGLALSSSQELPGGRTSIPLPRRGVQGTTWVVAGNFCATSRASHFQTRFFEAPQKYFLALTEGYGLREAERWPYSFAGR